MLLTCTWFICGFSLFAQQGMELQVIGSGGTTLSNTSGATMHFTTGELMVTEEQNNNILAQGFHQIILWFITPVKELPDLALVRVFPNPASEVLHIETNTPLSAALFDIHGRLVIAPTPIEEAGEMNLSHALSGNYFLQTFDRSGKRLQTVLIQVIR